MTQSRNTKSKKPYRNYQQHPYHLVKPSPWPISVSLSIFLFLFSFVMYLHGLSYQGFILDNYDAIVEKLYLMYGPDSFNLMLKINLLHMSWSVEFIAAKGLNNGLLLGLCSLTLALSSWFWDIIIEATFEGSHTKAVQANIRLGFALFIVSEIMFFFSFFWAFFHFALSPSIWIGVRWPPLGIKPMYPWALPLLNTVILVSSGITVTWAHKQLVLGLTYQSRVEIIKALFSTITLGAFFTYIQLYEYKHAHFAINDSVYGSCFYMLTGFHGVHVIIGTIFLFVCLIRHICYHFTSTHHVGFELAIWYWHSVDIAWIFLFLFVYIWGS